MAEIIEFPTRELSSIKPVNDEHFSWEEKALASLKEPLEQDQAYDEGVSAILSLFEQEIENPEERRKFGLFLFEQMFDASLALERRESLAAAVAALFAGPEHNNLLIPKLVLGTKEERIVAAVALGFAGNETALGPLKTLLSEKDIDLQKAAAFGLSGLKDGVIDHKIVEIFLEQLSENQEDALLVSILVNLKLFAASHLEPIFLSFTHHASLNVQKTALGGLLFCCSQKGLNRAQELLQASDDTLRAIALSILERHGSRKHLEAILPLMGDETPRIRQMARETLSHLRKKRPTSFLSH